MSNQPNQLKCIQFLHCFEMKIGIENKALKPQHIAEMCMKGSIFDQTLWNKY